MNVNNLTNKIKLKKYALNVKRKTSRCIDYVIAIIKNSETEDLKDFAVYVGATCVAVWTLSFVILLIFGPMYFALFLIGLV